MIKLSISGYSLKDIETSTEFESTMTLMHNNDVGIEMIRDTPTKVTNTLQDTTGMLGIVPPNHSIFISPGEQMNGKTSLLGPFLAASKIMDDQKGKYIVYGSPSSRSNIGRFFNVNKLQDTFDCLPNRKQNIEIAIEPLYGFNSSIFSTYQSIVDYLHQPSTVLKAKNWSTSIVYDTGNQIRSDDNTKFDNIEKCTNVVHISSANLSSINSSTLTDIKFQAQLENVHNLIIYNKYMNKDLQITYESQTGLDVNGIKWFIDYFKPLI